MHLLSESAKEKLDRERFLGNLAMKSRKPGLSWLLHDQWLSRLEAETLYPRFDLLPYQHVLIESLMKDGPVAMTVLKGRSPGLSTIVHRHREMMMQALWMPGLKKTFRRSEAAKACRMAIDVISNEWLDKQFGGAA